MRLKKSSDPDCGTYEVDKAKMFLDKHTVKVGFAKSNNVKFTVEQVNLRKSIPGVGAYETLGAYKKIAIPYLKKRL